ncbi:MAG: hypothetical protein GY926_23725 [bacterium]|nr:hypothetical protein [bacterium]
MRTQDRGPLRRRGYRYLYAALVACVALLVFSCGEDESEPASPTAVEEPSGTGDELELFDEGWEAVETDEQGLDVDFGLTIYGMPDGGFLALNVFSWALHVSPDGREWFDADPQGLTTKPVGWFTQDPIATTDDKVVFPSLNPPGVWIGDPLAGSWDVAAVDLTHPDQRLRPLAVAASDQEALLVAAVGTGDPLEDLDFEVDDFAVWVIDLATGTSQRHQLPESFTRLERTGPGPDQGPPGSGAIAAWVSGRWLVVPTWCSCSTIYSSVDGETWSESEMRWSPNGDPADAVDSETGDAWYQSDAMFTAGGREAIMISYRGGLPYAYSEDAGTWLAVESELDAEWGGLTDSVAYSDELGFVAIGDGIGSLLRMTDDKVWKYAGSAPSEVRHVTSIAASKDRLLAITDTDPGTGSSSSSLWLWIE